MPAILATQEAEIRRIRRPYLEKPFTKIGLVEWLKVKALSSSPRTAKKEPLNLINNEIQIKATMKCYLTHSRYSQA
jgi:hypothetical protein